MKRSNALLEVLIISLLLAACGKKEEAPVAVLMPFRVNVPDPVLTSLSAPSITPANAVLALLPPIVSVLAFALLLRAVPTPVREAMV